MPILTIQQPSQAKTSSRKAVGIDLGTTHSLVAYQRDGKVEVLADDQGNKLIPSVVYYESAEKIFVGSEAKDKFIADPQNTIISVKRLMGKSPQDVLSKGQNLPYSFVDSQAKLSQLKTRAGNVTPIEVSAQILKKLLTIAHQTHSDIHEAVITVPAYFDDAQRQATKDAARVAGIQVLRLLNEPTAAAIAYGLDQNTSGTCLVFDLGGGTFDVSLLQLNQGVFQVLATAGDTALGGDDIDHLVAQWVLSKAPMEMRNIHFAELLHKARVAKETLSQSTSTSIHLENGFSCTLNLQDLNQMIASFVDKTLAICRRALMDAKLNIADLDHVVLVGGSTRLTLIKEKVQAYFGKVPLCSLDPDQVVAMGAAMQASILSGQTQNQEMLLLDVLPLSLGIEMMGGVVEKILLRNSPVPAFATEEFTTYQDGQNGMSLHVVQGERELAKDCRSLAKFDLTGFPAMPAGKARISVTFRVDVDGLLSVEAKELSTNIYSHIEVKPTYGLSEDVVQKMLEESILYAEEDVHERKLQLNITEAKNMITSFEKALLQDGQLLSSSSHEAIIHHLSQLKQGCESRDLKQIVKSTKHLEDLGNEFAQIRINAALKIAVQGKSVDDFEKTLS